MAGTRLAIHASFMLSFFILIAISATPVLLKSFPFLQDCYFFGGERYSILLRLPTRIQQLEKWISESPASTEDDTRLLQPWYHVTLTLLFIVTDKGKDMVNVSEEAFIIDTFYNEAKNTLSDLAKKSLALTEISFEIQTDAISDVSLEEHETYSAISHNQLSNVLKVISLQNHRHGDASQFLSSEIYQSGYLTKIQEKGQEKEITFVIARKCPTVGAQNTTTSEVNDTPLIIKNFRDSDKATTSFIIPEYNGGVGIWNPSLENLESSVENLWEALIIKSLLKLDPASFWTDSDAALIESARKNHIPKLRLDAMKRLKKIMSLVHLHQSKMTISTIALQEMERCYEKLGQDDPDVIDMHMTSLILDRLYYTESSEISIMLPQSRSNLPKEQILAIMAPMVVPLILPLILGLVREVKRYLQRKRTI